MELEQPIELSAFASRVNAVLPDGMRIVDAFVAGDSIDTLSKLIIAARYELTVHFETSVPTETVKDAVQTIMESKELIVDKKTKSGVKPTDIRPDILEAYVKDASEDTAIIDVVGSLTAAGGLRAESFVRVLFDRLHLNGYFTAHRVSLYFTGSGSERLPRLN